MTTTAQSSSSSVASLSPIAAATAAAPVAQLATATVAAGTIMEEHPAWTGLKDIMGMLYRTIRPCHYYSM
jgi:hypothetical protein